MSKEIKKLMNEELRKNLIEGLNATGLAFEIIDGEVISLPKETVLRIPASSALGEILKECLINNVGVQLLCSPLTEEDTKVSDGHILSQSDMMISDKLKTKIVQLDNLYSDKENCIDLDATFGSDVAMKIRASYIAKENSDIEKFEKLKKDAYDILKQKMDAEEYEAINKCLASNTSSKYNMMLVSEEVLDSISVNNGLNKDDGETCSALIDGHKANVSLNLSPLVDKITRPVFSERTVTIADQQEVVFEVKEGKIDSTKSLKALNDKYPSEGMGEFDKSTEVRTADNYRLSMLLTEMNKAGVVSDELKDKLLDPNADYNLEGNSYEARKEAYNKLMQDFKDNDRKREQAHKVLSEFCRGKDLWNIEDKPVIKTGLEGSFINPNLDYKEELKTQLFETLNKNELEYKVSGEGVRQVITIPRATLVQIKDNEEVCSIIIDCYKANMPLNLLGSFECPNTLNDKIATLEISDIVDYIDIDNVDRLIFNKPNHKSKKYLDLEKLLINHIIELLNDEDVKYSRIDIIDSCKNVVPQFSKSLIEEIVSDVIKERGKTNSTIVDIQTFFDNMNSFELTNELSNISSIADNYFKRATSGELKDKEKELRQELKGEIDRGNLASRFGQEIADLIVEARVAEESGNKEHYFKYFEDAIDILNYGTIKEEVQNAIDSLETGLTEEFYREVYNVLLPVDLHDKTLSTLRVIVEHSDIAIKSDSVLISAILRVLTSDLEFDDVVTSDRVNILLLQDYTLNETIDILENKRTDRFPSEHQYSNLSANDYCRIFLNLYEKKGNLKDQEVYKFLLENGYDIKRVRQELGLNPNTTLPVSEILDNLDVFEYSNYELVLYCYFLIGNHLMDSIDSLVNIYCESKGKIDSSFFNTSVANSNINEIITTAYEETKASYKDLLRIYLKTESVDKYNKELKAYNEVKEKVEKEKNLVRKEELIKESKEIMSLANTYKFSETSITNIQVSKLEMKMSNKIYKMVGEKIYYKYFDFISLSCIAGSRRIVYLADKDNAKYGNRTITEEMSKSISLGNTLVEPNKTIVIGMNYDYILSLAPEYRCKLARRILRKDIFFGFATDVIDNSKVKNSFEISCRKREANGILIDSVLTSVNNDLVLLRDGEFTSLKDINYEVFTLIADFMEYGIIACLDTKAYNKIIGFYKRNNYPDSVINKVVNLNKFMNTVYDGFTLDKDNMKLVVSKNGIDMVTPINKLNYKSDRLLYVK